MDIIPIAILASDPITWEGSVALLSAHPDLLILPPELRPHARVLLVITPAVTETVLRDLGLEPVVELSTDSVAERAICVRHARYPSASGVLLPN